MRLTPQEKDRVHSKAVIAVLFVIVLSIAGAVGAAIAARDNLRFTLSERSQSIAEALDARTVAKLSGTETDAGIPEYRELKTTLGDIKKVNPDVLSIYLMGQRGADLLFFVDSEQPASDLYSPPGELYPDGTPENQAMFENGKPLVEGPIQDGFGNFISGLAPVFKEDGTIAAVVGIDVGSNMYWRGIILSALLPLLAGTTIVLIIAVFERIRRHNQQLLALRSELVSVASHELRTPITGIRWAAESMQKISTEPKVLKLADAIKNSAVSLQNSTNDILELSHATNGRELAATPTDLVPLVKEVVDTQALSAEQKQVRIEFDSYWPQKLTVHIDPDQMRRAIHNVISNAIKYTREGTVITVSYQQDAKHHKMLVTDQGIGIPAAEQSKVFRGFYRASNAVKSDVPGTGLGLYLVKTVLQRHGGSVSFVSQENKGTTFTLTLPKTK